MTKEAARNMVSLSDEIEYSHGQPLTAPENKLIVLGEGGTGDRITYTRWLPKLTELGIDWMYYPDASPPIPGLYQLMERVPWMKDRLRKAGDQYTASHWTTVFSLPANFDAIPTQIPNFPSPLCSRSCLSRALQGQTSRKAQHYRSMV